MGMDVYGRKPTAPGGEYFRANVWSWPAVLAAMMAAGLEVPDDWSFNDGQGLDSDEDCQKYADALEKSLDSITGTCVVLPEENMGNAVLRALGQGPVKSTSIDRDQILRWIDFLRHCGGFEIC